MVQPGNVLAVNNTAATAVPLRALPEVKGIFGWGYTLLNRFGDPSEPYQTYLNNVTALPPFFFANGEYDQIGNTTKDTFDRVPGPVTAAAVLADLNHFSIADRQVRACPSSEVISTHACAPCASRTPSLCLVMRTQLHVP